jgi:integrase
VPTAVKGTVYVSPNAPLSANRRLRVIEGNEVRTIIKPPQRRTNAESGREREYLTPLEIDRLVKTARRRGRHGSRDALAILMGFRHGLRVSELVALRWSQIDFVTARLTVHRAKGSTGSTHPVLGDELRELRKIQRDQPAGSQFIFVGERGPVSVAWFQRMIKRVGVECGLPLVHGHMLRHSAGFALADKGRDLREIQDFLGHRSINNTVIYTKLRPGRFDRIWD